MLERVDGAVDQIAAVIERPDRHPGRQARRDLAELHLDPLDDRLGILAAAHHHRAAYRFLAVEIQRATAEIGAELDRRQIPQIDRDPILRLHRDQFQILRGGDQPHAAQHEFRAVFLDGLAADIEVGILHRGEHLHQRDVGGTHLGGRQLDLILFDKAADAGDLGDALHAGEFITDLPILQRAELRQVIAAVRRLGRIDVQIVLIDPAQPRGVRTELRLHPLGHRALQIVEPLQHPGAGEVGVHPFLEDDGQQREAEHRTGAHLLDPGQTLQAGGQRIGHLVLHLLRAAAHPFAIHQHLVFC